MISVESAAAAYLAQKGWNTTPSGVDQIQVHPCPICALSGIDCDKFFINASGSKMDGLWKCFKTDKAGNLLKLQELQGDRVAGLVSMRDGAMAHASPPPLPDVASAHRKLLEDEDALDYLVATRHFSMDVIEKMRLGVMEEVGKKWLVIPYFNRGNLVFVKQRSLPPADKEFRASAGREVPLYNEDALTKDMESIFFVEGEADCLAMLSHGFTNVVGVPGAKVHKAAWIERLDKLSPKKIYLLYDNDQVGQDSAREMAKRIGIEKCFNIVLPKERGKDINEWFVAGGTAEELRELAEAAQPFPVEGVKSCIEVFDDIEREINERGSVKPTYDFLWQTVSNKVGAEPGDVIDVLADGKIGKTTFCMNQLDYINAKYDEPVLDYCFEMTHRRLGRKFLSMLTQTDISPPKDEAEAHTRLEAVRKAIPLAKQIMQQRTADFLFAYNRVQNPEEAFELIYQAKRRYGVKWVCLDNIQLLCDSTLQSLSQRTAHLSKISKQIKLLANELNIVVLRIVQPNRIREGEIADSRNSDGASQIEKDCDAMLVLHRNKRITMKARDFVGYMDEFETLDPQMLVKVALTRYSGGGFTTLWFDGALNSVRECTPDEINNLPRPEISNGAVPVETVDV